MHGPNSKMSVLLLMSDARICRVYAKMQGLRAKRAILVAAQQRWQTDTYQRKYEYFIWYR